MQQTYDSNPYCKFGQEHEEHQQDGVWELILSEFVSAIDPKNYFVTSGEAVQKAKKLEEDLFKMAGKARKLRYALEKARQPAVYLESEYTEVGLIIKRKNPRNKKPKDQE